MQGRLLLQQLMGRCEPVRGRALHGFLQQGQVAAAVDHQNAVVGALGNALDVSEDAQVTVKPGGAVPVYTGVVVGLLFVLKGLPEKIFMLAADGLRLVPVLN